MLKMRWLCIFVALSLSGCFKTTTRLKSSEKENISSTTIVFVEKKVPFTVDRSYSSYTSRSGFLFGSFAKLIAGLIPDSDVKRIKSICNSCSGFDFNGPVRTRLLEMFENLNWMGCKNFCTVDCYKNAKKGLFKIAPGTLYIIVQSYYVFNRRFSAVTGVCDLELYKCNKKLNSNSSNRKKSRMAKLIYNQRSFSNMCLKRYNYIFGIDKNVKQWYEKLPKHIDAFAKSFARRYFNDFKD